MTDHLSFQEHGRSQASSTPAGAWRLRYAPGEWLVCAGTQVVVVLRRTPECSSDVIAALWPDVECADGRDAALAALAQHGLDRQPDLAIAVAGDGFSRCVLRGKIQVRELGRAGLLADGTGRADFVEVDSHGSVLRLEFGAPGGADPLLLPLGLGVALCSTLNLALRPKAELDAPAPEQGQGSGPGGRRSSTALHAVYDAPPTPRPASIGAVETAGAVAPLVAPGNQAESPASGSSTPETPEVGAHGAADEAGAAQPGPTEAGPASADSSSTPTAGSDTAVPGAAAAAPSSHHRDWSAASPEVLEQIAASGQQVDNKTGSQPPPEPSAKDSQDSGATTLEFPAAPGAAEQPDTGAQRDAGVVEWSPHGWTDESMKVDPGAHPGPDAFMYEKTELLPPSAAQATRAAGPAEETGQEREAGQDRHPEPGPSHDPVIALPPATPEPALPPAEPEPGPAGAATESAEPELEPLVPGFGPEIESTESGTPGEATGTGGTPEAAQAVDSADHRGDSQPAAPVRSVDVSRSDTNSGPGGTASPPPGAVLAQFCPSGHPNRPGATLCRVCGLQVVNAPPQPVQRPLLADLVTSGGQLIQLDGPVLIGRAPRPQPDEAASVLRVQSPHHDISRTHVRVAPHEWDIAVTDMNSTNGTIVFEVGNDPVRLGSGNTVLVGLGTVIDLGDGQQVSIEAPRG